MSDAPPVLWEYAEQTYQAMLERAGRVDEKLVYEGFISRMIIEELKFPVPSYGKILYVLRQMGCIEQLKRGGGPTPSKWVLWKTPTLEDFNKVHGPVRSKYETQVSRMEQRIDDLTRQIGGVNIPQALTDLTLRLERLENGQGADSS